MRQLTLTIIDTSGIQDYVFRANNLKQNIGASYLVDCATRDWAVEALAGLRHNVIDINGIDQPFDLTKAIESNSLDAELIYAGGGNTMLLFAQRANAIEFTQRLTRKALFDAPGLCLNIAHQDFDWDTQPLGGEEGIVAQAFKLLSFRKTDPPASGALFGLGATAQCVFTGLPATTYDTDDHPVSAEAEAKLKVADDANARFKNLIDFSPFSKEPPLNVDELGQERGEKSYIAIVHADGNGMGKRVLDIRKAFPEARQNRSYIDKMRSFSLSVQKAANLALQSTADYLKKRAMPEKNPTTISGIIKLKDGKIPLRPIIFGGDDVTFVCEGRLGLNLAVAYLEAYSKETLADGEKAFCRAGVSIVKSHYPFSRAYEMAEALCKSAKEAVLEQDRDGKAVAIDWHFAINGLALDIETIREREYRVKAGSLLARPLTIAEDPTTWRNWDTFEKVTHEFTYGKWSERRNKVKSLREVLRKGPEATRNMLALLETEEPGEAGLRLPDIASIPEAKTTGWSERRCAYFDAIEAMDFIMPWEETTKR